MTQSSYISVFFPTPITITSRFRTIRVDEIVACPKHGYLDFVLVKYNGSMRAFAKWNCEDQTALWEAVGASTAK